MMHFPILRTAMLATCLTTPIVFQAWAGPYGGSHQGGGPHNGGAREWPTGVGAPGKGPHAGGYLPGVQRSVPGGGQEAREGDRRGHVWTGANENREGWHGEGRHDGWQEAWGVAEWQRSGWRDGHGPFLAVTAGPRVWDWRSGWGFGRGGWWGANWGGAGWIWGGVDVGLGAALIAAPPFLILPPPIYAEPPPIVLGLPAIVPPSLYAGAPPVAPSPIPPGTSHGWVRAAAPRPVIVRPAMVRPPPPVMVAAAPPRMIVAPPYSVVALPPPALAFAPVGPAFWAGGYNARAYNYNYGGGYYYGGGGWHGEYGWRAAYARPIYGASYAWHGGAGWDGYRGSGR